MTAFPPSDDEDLFDEAGYLRLNSGIATAIAIGGVDTARGHYLLHGRAEGRAPNDVDPAFYLAAYPDLDKDLGRPAAAEDAARHYLRFGRARGYLPNARAPRPPDASAPPSPFGGFWTDRANAADLVQGRLALGWIGRRDAAWLLRFAQDGIAQLERPIEMELTRAAGLAVSQAFTGLFPELRFGAGGVALPWTPELTSLPVAALDPHLVSRPIRDLLFSPEIRDTLARIFEAPPRLTASRAWLREDTAPDRDVSWLAHSLPLQCVAVTFSLEEEAPFHLAAWPGSHHWPDILWADLHPSLPEASRLGLAAPTAAARRETPAAAAAHRETMVRAAIGERDPVAYEVPPGTALVRHVNLIHTVQPPEPLRQRRVLTAWYCPAHVAPCHAETAPARLLEQDGFIYSSGASPSPDRSD